MDTTQQSAQLIEAWARQRIWSQLATRLKQRIDRARLAALLQGIATAVLAVAVSQIGGVGAVFNCWTIRTGAEGCGVSVWGFGWVSIFL